MGQSFLTHDEKSSTGSPSPDLLQFNGMPHPKFFGSLSSIKETSLSSSSRSPLESDSERNLVTSTSPPNTYLVSSLLPTPIRPGNVSRLREKFMDFDKERSECREKEAESISSNENPFKKETLSELDYHIRPATTTPCALVRRTTRTRSRNSLSTLSPYSNRILRKHPECEKLDVIRSDHYLTECFKQMEISSCNTGNYSGNSVEVVRHRPRTRPYVLPTRSVIIRAGYLPVIQTVDFLPGRGNWSFDVLPTTDPNFTQTQSDECLRTSIPEHFVKREEMLKLGSPCPEEERGPSVVTNQGDHTSTALVVKKDAETNTSAEVLVLPKGTKTSVVLKTGVDNVDGKTSWLKRRKRKPVLQRISRTLGRIMIRVVELF